MFGANLPAEQRLLLQREKEKLMDIKTRYGNNARIQTPVEIQRFSNADVVT